jgi:hypothetical protein
MRSRSDGRCMNGIQQIALAAGPPAEVTAELADAERPRAPTTALRSLSARRPRSSDGQEHQPIGAKPSRCSSHREAWALHWRWGSSPKT